MTRLAKSLTLMVLGGLVIALLLAVWLPLFALGAVSHTLSKGVDWLADHVFSPPVGVARRVMRRGRWVGHYVWPKSEGRYARPDWRERLEAEVGPPPWRVVDLPPNSHGVWVEGSKGRFPLASRELETLWPWWRTRREHFNARRGR